MKSIKLKLTLLFLAIGCTFGTSAGAKYLEFIPAQDGTVTNGSLVQNSNISYNNEAESLLTSIVNTKQEKVSIVFNETIPLGTYNWCKIMHRYSDVSYQNENDSVAYLVNVMTDGWDNYSDVRLLSSENENKWIVDYFNLSEILEVYDSEEIQFFVANQNNSPQEGKVSAKHDMKYIVLFETEADAEAYDSSILGVTVGKQAAVIDKLAHTISVDVEQLAGSTIETPVISLIKGAKAVIPEDADFSNPVEIVITDISGKEIVYTMTVRTSDMSLPEGTMENCINDLNSANAETIATVFEENKSILYATSSEIENMNEEELGYLYKGIINSAGSFTEDNLVAILRECVNYSKLMTYGATVEGFNDVISERNLPIYMSNEYETWKEYLSDENKFSVLNFARGEEGYAAFNETFKEKALSVAMTTNSEWEKCKAIFELNLQRIGFTQDEYDAYIGAFNNKAMVFGNVVNAIEEGSADYKNLFIMYATQQKDAEQAKNDRYTGGGGSASVSGGSGGVMITGKVPVTQTKEPESVPEPEDNNEVTERFKFEDCDNYEWAKESIQNLYSAGIISGMTETTYSPEKNVTRAEFITMAIKALKLEAVAKESAFSDLSEDDWYFGSITAAYENGLISGVDENRVAPNENISRQDIAVICYRILKNKLSVVSDNVPSDSDAVADYAVEAVNSLFGAGILSGYEGNEFRPTQSATRAETAVIMNRIYEIVNAQ
ncbi:MAG: S-layer homology domain-containing protein [Clostridia bacterium]|nr:S-layer homology domain-containing protein [Clostridia bacterium]